MLHAENVRMPAFLVGSLSWLLPCSFFTCQQKPPKHLTTIQGLSRLSNKHWPPAQPSSLVMMSTSPPSAIFASFFLLGAALCNALRFSISPRMSFIVASVLASAYGVSDELHQIFVPTRSCDPLDWVVDTVAALLGALLIRNITQAIRKRRAHRG